MKTVCPRPLLQISLYGDLAAGLGPFDGRVAAHVWIENTRCFITTNARYVPSPPSSDANELLLRRDMRWGPDDPTLWPHEYNDHFAHFGAIPRRPSTEQDRETLAIMWWNPDRTDFTSPESGLTITRGLGKLSRSRHSALSILVDQLTAKCETYATSVSPPTQSNPLIAQLADSLRRGLVQLSSILATFEQMVIGVTNVQRAYIELAGLLQYLTVYIPRIEDPTFQGGLPDADVMGAFTSNPTVAENFHRARLPYWFIRPLRAFSTENILRVVEPLESGQWIEFEAVEGFPPIVVGSTLQQRMHGLHKGTDILPWYKDPFASGDAGKPLVMRLGPVKPSSTSAVVGSSSPVAGPSSAVAKPNNRKSPCTEPFYPPSLDGERNKYELFHSPYMAPAIPGWATALAAVDRSQIPACGTQPTHLYVFPEPALLIASEPRLQMYLHHYQLLRDALCYRMGDPDDLQSPLTISEWRDVLQGKVVTQGKAGSLVRKRSVAIEQVLGPAMRACRMERLDGFPVPPTTPTRGQEITWELAEMNFRYELCALDTRTTGLNRLDDCMKCFPGALLGPQLDEGKKGFAAIAPRDQLPFLLSLA
ncbi:hypothetical protein B0H19DRAFT_919818 [Mycena capillaripes]|nr:hypothetical protein B0H19DRAFT_919818 [Mycena capillaripes]